MATNDTTEQTTGRLYSPSRRSFLKKGALATGAVVLGVSGATPAVAQDDSNALIYTDDYQPNGRFRVVGLLPADITVRLLRRPNGNTIPEISQPDDYNGYVVRARLGGNRAGDSTFLFTRRALQQGRGYRLSADPQVFSSELSLLSARISRAG